ncbi:MAG TPA: hypothetical protein PKY38_08835, partial [Opitutaceae bacterium]|nr:hypothetical protein [Opitutaceae bacterium]
MSIRVADILPDGWIDLFDRNSPRIGIGLDPATTTKKKSNPSSITVTQQVGLIYYPRLTVRYKSTDPDVTHSLLDQIIGGLRGIGLRVRKVCILATNERYFAVAVRKKLATKAPVELVIESENITYLAEEMKVKAYLGNLFVNTIDEGYFALAPAEFIKVDLRLVLRDRGTFDAEIGKDGGHGDTFDSNGASLHALKGKGGPAEA